jgi:PAS domain S-box-containing protein
MFDGEGSQVRLALHYAPGCKGIGISRGTQMIFLTLVQNVALLIALVVVFEQITRRWQRDTVGRQALTGVLFGGACIVGMLTPLHLMPGIIFDGRSIVLSIAGLFGGPVTAAFAAAISAAYRLSLGGAGAWVGAAVIAASAGLGVFWYYLRRRRPGAARPAGLLGFGLAVHVVMLALMLALPGGASQEVLAQMALPALTLYPAGAWLLGMLFLDREAWQTSESALRESEERYRAIVESANEGVWAMDAGHATTYVNQRMADMLGYTPGEMIGTQVESYMLAEDLGDHASKMRERYIGKDQMYERRFRRKDGSTLWTVVSAAALKDATGAFRGSTALFTDITQRKQAEAALAAMNQALEDALRIARMAYWRYDVASGAFTFDDRFFAMCGATAEQEGGYTQALAAFAQRHAVPRFAREIEGIIQQATQSPDFSQGARADGQLIRLDGTLFWASIWFRAEKDAAGRATGLFGVVQDITERKQAEAEILDSAMRLQTAVQAGNIGLWDWDLRANRVFYSPEWKRQLGYAEDEFTSDSLEWQNHIHPDDLDNFLHQLSGLIEPSGAGFQFEYRFRHKDGTYSWIFSQASMLRDEDGFPARIVGSHVDITERRQMEDALRESERRYRQLNESLEQRVRERTEQLETANRELEAFSYSVSHDLRAPLRAMDGFSRLLVEQHASALPPEAARQLLRVRDGAQRMGQLIDDLLRFSRLSRQAVASERVDLAGLSRQMWEEDLLPDRAGRQACLEVGDLPVCRGDPALLRLVLINLLGNALKFTRCRPQARIEIGYADPPGAYFVKDNGTGFDMRYSGKLFGVFQRLHRADEYEGTGVGLAIVQRIVMRHGGRVWAEAEPDSGATFFFTLPPWGNTNTSTPATPGGGV